MKKSNASIQTPRLPLQSLTTALALLLITSVTESYSMAKDSALLSLLPEQMQDYTPSEKQVFQTDVELYDYINGGAELYLHYGFQKLAKKEYTADKRPRIKAEIFDLQSAKNAFGVFSYSRDTANVAIGQGAQYFGGSLIFWQDNYYVSIYTPKETAASKRAVLEMAHTISRAIKSTGPLPPLISALPEKNRVHGSVLYFRYHGWQNKYRYISNDNIFRIDDNVDAVLAQYGAAPDRYYLLLLEYPDKKQAQKAHKNAKKQLKAMKATRRITKEKPGKWLGHERTGQMLMAVFDAPEKATAAYLLDKAKQLYATKN